MSAPTRSPADQHAVGVEQQRSLFEAMNGTRPAIDEVDEGLVFLRVPRSRGRELRLSVVEYKGASFVHVREWYVPVGDGHRLRPGKGVSLSVKEAGQLTNALQGVVLQFDPGFVDGGVSPAPVNGTTSSVSPTPQLVAIQTAKPSMGAPKPSTLSKRQCAFAGCLKPVQPGRGEKLARYCGKSHKQQAYLARLLVKIVKKVGDAIISTLRRRGPLTRNELDCEVQSSVTKATAGHVDAALVELVDEDGLVLVSDIGPEKLYSRWAPTPKAQQPSPSAPGAAVHGLRAAVESEQTTAASARVILAPKPNLHVVALCVVAGTIACAMPDAKLRTGAAEVTSSKQAGT